MDTAPTPELRRDEPRRRFTLLDGMVLIAAIAAGLGAARVISQSHLGSNITSAGDAWTLLLLAAHWLVIAAPCAVSLSITLLVLRFVRPRPPRRRMFRQPGTVAILAGALCPLTSAWPSLPLILALSPASRSSDWDEVLAIIAVLQNGAAVAVAWTALRLAVRRRARRDWIERAGIALGAYWIVTNLATCVMIVGGWL